MRVLVVKMSSLGDVIHTLPALSDASRAIPGISFDWVVEEAFAEIPGWHPAVDKVIPVAIRRWRKRPFRDFRGPEWRGVREALRRRHYDAVIDAQGLLKSAVITWLVAAPRYGMDSQSVRERFAALAYHHRIAVPREMHAVERIRLLFARALNYPLLEEPGDYGVRESLTTGAHEGLAPCLLFFHGTARAEKLWPEEHWIELIALATEQGYSVWLPWGSEPERERAQRLAGHREEGQTPFVKVLPRLDLLGLATLLLQASGAVAVDTGLGHLSAALDVPTVSLYGPTRTRLIGAYGRNQVHIQSPVGATDTSDARAMMRSISAPMAWRELQAILPGTLQSGTVQSGTFHSGSS